METVIDEVSVVADKNTLIELYQTATYEPYSIICVELAARHKHELCYPNVNKKLKIQHE